MAWFPWFLSFCTSLVMVAPSAKVAYYPSRLSSEQYESNAMPLSRHLHSGSDQQHLAVTWLKVLTHQRREHWLVSHGAVAMEAHSICAQQALSRGSAYRGESRIRLSSRDAVKNTPVTQWATTALILGTSNTFWLVLGFPFDLPTRKG